MRNRHTQNRKLFWACLQCRDMEKSQRFLMQQARPRSYDKNEPSSPGLASPFQGQHPLKRSAKLEMEERLINLVQGYLQLYNLSSSYYYDTKRRNNAWRYYMCIPRFWLLSNNRRDSRATSQAPWIKGWKRHSWCFRHNIWAAPKASEWTICTWPRHGNNKQLGSKCSVSLQTIENLPKVSVMAVSAH